MDWQKHRLIVMGVIAVVLIGITYWVVDSGTGDTQPDEPEESATPDLPEVERDEITELEIHLPANEDEELEAVTVRLVKDGEAWRLEEPVAAEASLTAVNTALDKVSDLEVTGRAASNPQFHERLEVDPAHGIRVIARTGGETAIDVWIGAYQSGNTMVRPEGQDVVLTVRGSIKFAFNKRPRDWRNRTITELTANEVRQVEFRNENGHWVFDKTDDEWAQTVAEPAPPAEGEEPEEPEEGEEGEEGGFDSGRVNTIVSGLARMRAADFAAPDVTPEAAGIGESSAIVRMVVGEGDDEVTTLLRVGNELEEGQRYVMVQGNDTIYVVNRYMADRALPSEESFEAGAEPAAPPPGGPHGMPGMPGMPGGGPGGPGGGQIPPEIMQQIQQQLQAQGAGGGGGGHP